MGQVIDLPPSRQARADAPACGARILLFTGVWRERYETTPAVREIGAVASAKSGRVKRMTKTSRDNPKGPNVPKRGKKRA